jgi:putative ABC transport system ATP-binding protein
MLLLPPLSLVGTIDKPTKGDIWIDNNRITNKTTDSEFALLRLRNIGFVFQTFNLIASMTASENVELPMILDGRRSRSERVQRAANLLDRVGMGARLDHAPSQLSGGEQQRVTIARAIANSPDLLLLDEPTGDLDSKNSYIIMQLLLDLNRNHGITCVMVTHDQALKTYAHRVVHMLDGKIARIEPIAAAARAQAEQELQDSLANVDAPVQQDAEIEYRDPYSYYAYHAQNNEQN